MLKTILSLKGAQQLSKSALKSVSGGNLDPWEEAEPCDGWNWCRNSFGRCRYCGGS